MRNGRRALEEGAGEQADAERGAEVLAEIEVAAAESVVIHAGAEISPTCVRATTGADRRELWSVGLTRKDSALLKRTAEAKMCLCT